jgi:hypothetical protein
VDTEDPKAIESMTDGLISRFPAASPSVILEIVIDALRESLRMPDPELRPGSGEPRRGRPDASR